MQATPDVNLIAAIVPPLVVLILIITVAVPVITMCLCRKRGNELQQQGLYYSKVELPPLPPRNKALKRDAEPQYWTITDIKEYQRKPPILHSADDTDSQPIPTCHEAEASNHYHAVQEQELDQSCVTVTSDGLSHYSANTISHPDVTNVIGSHGDSYGGETATAMIPLTDIHPAHCTGAGVAPDILENSESLSTTLSTAITVPLTANQACGTGIAQRVSSNNESTTKPTHGAAIPTEDVETDTNIAYSCNDDIFAVTDNPSYSTDIAIAPDVSTQENVAYSIKPSQSVCDDDVANITGGHGDSYGGETATAMTPLTDIHPAHCTSAGIAPDKLENSESLSTTHSTAITEPLTESQVCDTDIVSSRYEITTKPTHGADITTEDVETDVNIAYSCNDVTFAVIDNPAYSTDIAIAPHVSTQENVAYNVITPSLSVCDDLN